MRLLFQGDSITDAGWERNDFYSLGNGYASLAAGMLRECCPDIKWEFINRGISGNRADDLAARWQEDCIDLCPDIVSVLIGINDTSRAVNSNNINSVQQYEDNYRVILEEIKNKTNTKILILEPFLIHSAPDKEGWRPYLNPKIDAARRLAREFADGYIPLDGLFAAASVQKEPSHWSEDGVHPLNAGAQLIASAYVKTLTKDIL